MPGSVSSKSTEQKQILRTKGAEYAKKRVEGIFSKSSIADNVDAFPIFRQEEVDMGKVLGKGGFGTVYEIRRFEADLSKQEKKERDKKRSDRAKRLGLTDKPDEEVRGGEQESRKFISDHALRNTGDARYAAKLLSPEVIADPAMYIQGIIDMALETRFLSDMDHPNIIKMRACGGETPFSTSYFLVLDRLFDTMETRIEKWNKAEKRATGIGGKLIFDRKGSKKKDILEAKLVATFDLSAAIGYLHARRVLYRDLKPENIGFDIRDDVKLFDFGLAKELHSGVVQESSGLYKMTGLTGSPRYMAPEVGKEEPYNGKCDVYSFAILFWQMFSGKTPFDMYTLSALKSRVWDAEGEQKRPFVPADWPVPIKSLLRRSWSSNIDERPNFQQIYKILRTECVRVRDGNDTGLEHTRRRSTFVFRGSLLEGGQKNTAAIAAK